MEEKTLIVDRIEGQIAVCEQAGGMTKIPLTDIDGPPREGDVLRQTATGRYAVDDAATAERRARLNKRFQALIKK